MLTGRLRSLVFGWVSRRPVTGQGGVVKSHRKRLGSNRAAAIPIGGRLILPPCGLPRSGSVAVVASGSAVESWSGASSGAHCSKRGPTPGDPPGRTSRQ